jgi:hypothetical protein
LTRTVRSFGGEIAVQPPAVFYPVPPSQTFRLFREPGLRLPRATRIVHWVASNHRALGAAGPAQLCAGRGLFHRLASDVATRAAARAA